MMARGGGSGLLLVLMAAAVGGAEGVEVCKVAELSLVTQTGEFFLAVTFLGLGLTAIIFTLMACKASYEKRKFYFATCYLAAVSTFAYYAMLSGQGWIITPDCRQIFYVRYLDWVVTTPLLLMNLAMIVGADWAVTIAVMAADMLMIFGGYMSAISSGHIKWLWFTVGLMIFIPIMYVVLVVWKGLVQRSHPAVGELYNKLAWLTLIVWSCYPVVFIFSEGTSDWSPNFEVMITGILDLISKALFGFILLLSHEALDRICRFASISGSYGTQMGEKAAVESYI